MSKIRFGIIGAAGRGNSYVGNLQANPATAITALCDVREQEVKARAAELDIAHAFTDAEAMLAEPSRPPRPPRPRPRAPGSS